MDQIPASLPPDVFVKLFGPRCSAAAALPSDVRHAAVPHPVLRDVVAPYLVVGTIQFQTPLEVVRATECLSFDMTLVSGTRAFMEHHSTRDEESVDVFGLFSEHGENIRRIVVDRHRVPTPLRLIAALIERWAPRLLLHHTVRHRTALYKAYARGGGGRGVTDFGCPLSEALADVPIAREVLRQAAPTLQVYAEGTSVREAVLLPLLQNTQQSPATGPTAGDEAAPTFPRLQLLTFRITDIDSLFAAVDGGLFGRLPALSRLDVVFCGDGRGASVTEPSSVVERLRSAMGQWYTAEAVPPVRVIQGS